MDDSNAKGRGLVRAAVLSAAAAVVLALSACNTVEGVGKDLQEASQNTKEALSD